jgi:hypothetical protein
VDVCVLDAVFDLGFVLGLTRGSKWRKLANDCKNWCKTVFGYVNICFVNKSIHTSFY